MLQQSFSSTEREVVTNSPAALGTGPGTGILQMYRLQNITDSQAVKVCIVGMKGTNDRLEAVTEVYLMFAVTDTDAEVVWRPWPQTEDCQRHADALSKYEDGS